MTDPLADMLTRIRNAYLANKKDTSMPFSKLKFSLGQKLVELGYVESVSEIQNGTHKEMQVKLAYKNHLPKATHIKRISKPGRRVYSRTDKIPTTLAGFGSTIISTSRGLLTDKEAKKAGIGGEVICQIW